MPCAGLLRVRGGVYDGGSGVSVRWEQHCVEHLRNIGNNFTDPGGEELNHWFQKGIKIHG